MHSKQILPPEFFIVSSLQRVAISLLNLDLPQKNGRLDLAVLISWMSKIFIFFDSHLCFSLHPLILKSYQRAKKILCKSLC